MKHHKLPLLPAAVLAVGACLLLAPNAIAAEARTKLNSADTKFIQEESAAGAALVRIAELGVKKAERADVKAFAGMIATDHTKANAELATLADSKGVALSKEVDNKHANTYEKLEGESGARFDKEFLSVMVSSHETCLENFQDAAEDSQDSEVKQWAAKMLPAQKAHLEKAEELSSAPTEKTGTATTRNSATEPDNTDRNKRDRDARTLTPLDQGNSKTDTDTTARIRKGILDLENLSVNAQNVKIITKEGHVTLRGPVKTEEEKRLIGEVASRAVTAEHTDNQLEVEGARATN